MNMSKYLKKGQIVYFVQTWDKEKPEIKCYSSLGEYMRLPDDENEVGYGKLSIDRDNIVHLWSGEVDKEHLEKYIAKMKNRNLEIVAN